jgi:glycosyltransferase involved in cell wall biosynthesis
VFIKIWNCVDFINDETLRVRIQMKIVMLSDQESKGGAAIAASRLAEALSKANHEIVRIVYRKDENPHPWSTEVASISASKMERGASKVFSHLNLKTPETHKWELSLQEILHRHMPDVINVHNLHSAGWPPELVEICAKQAPTVWTLHDMWSFTGRCAYSYDCEKFISGCDSTCPTPDEYPALKPELISSAWKRRKKILSKNPSIVAVSPSKWLSGVANRGQWSNHRVDVIPNGIPLDIYHPIDRQQARKELGIETTGPVLLVAAADLNDKRKGMGMFVQSLNRVRTRPLTLISFGAGSPFESVKNVQYISMGPMAQEQIRNFAYSAADCYVHPAISDNLPNTVLESMASGTPVVAFEVGGLTDLVRPDQSGWLCRESSAAALADVLDQALDAIQSGVNLRESCRKITVSEYGTEEQARRYLRLFQEMIGYN